MQEDSNPDDNIGIILSLTVEDVDQDGNPDDTDPNPLPDVSFNLAPGLTLIGLPVVPTSHTTAAELASALGADRIERLENGVWQVYDATSGTGDFALEANRGYAVRQPLGANGVATITGDAPPTTIDLNDGVNLVGFPLDTGTKAFDLMAQIGGDAVVVTVTTYDPATGRYLTAAFNDDAQPVGTNFTIERGRAYYVTVRGPVLGFELR